jgi:hypothetical protein
MIFLSTNVIMNILRYNSPYHNRFQNCIVELNILIKKYNTILQTYNNVIEIDKKFFKNFDPIFYKFFRINIR